MPPATPLPSTIRTARAKRDNSRTHDRQDAPVSSSSSSSSPSSPFRLPRATNHEPEAHLPSWCFRSQVHTRLFHGIRSSSALRTYDRRNVHRFIRGAPCLCSERFHSRRRLEKPDALRVLHLMPTDQPVPILSGVVRYLVRLLANPKMPVFATGPIVSIYLSSPFQRLSLISSGFESNVHPSGPTLT